MNSAQINPNEPRLVVAGAFGTRPRLDVDPTFGTDDEWGEYISTVVDNASEAMDFTTPEELGRLDAMDNIYNPPRHSTEAFDAYIISWNNQWAKTEGRKLSR